MDIRCETDIDAPVATAFAYYCDQERLDEWIPGGGLIEFTAITPVPKRVGSRYRVAYRLFGLTYRLIAEVKVLEDGRLSVKEQVSGDYKAWRYSMGFKETAPGRTHLTMLVHAELPWGVAGRLAETLGRSFVQRDLDASIRRFKLRTEAVHARAGAAAALATG